MARRQSEAQLAAKERQLRGKQEARELDKKVEWLRDIGAVDPDMIDKSRLNSGHMPVTVSWEEQDRIDRLNEEDAQKRAAEPEEDIEQAVEDAWSLSTKPLAGTVAVIHEIEVVEVPTAPVHIHVHAEAS